MFKIEYANNPTNLQNELKDLRIFHVTDKSLHGIRKHVSGDYTGEFEEIGILIMGEDF